MGKNHARVLQSLKGVDVFAVVDPDLAAASEVARLHGGRVVADVDGLLKLGKPDAAVVAVPTQHHFAVTRTLLEADVPVLVEKPIAASMTEARALDALASDRGLVLAVGHVERFNPAIQLLFTKLREGALGRVFQIRARRVGPFPARIRDVGVALDLATHDIDAMRFLLGADVVRAYAETKREVHTSREDLVSALLRFEDETVGHLEVNWLTPTKARELTVTGERGTFHVDYLTQDLSFYENADAREVGWSTMSVLRGVSEGSMTRFAVSRAEPLRVELEAFLAAVRGDASRIVRGVDGIAALEVAAAITSSGEGGQVVTLRESAR